MPEDKWPMEDTVILYNQAKENSVPSEFGKLLMYLFGLNVAFVAGVCFIVWTFTTH